MCLARREQDEMVCPICRKRWAVTDRRPCEAPDVG
jgi:hypothetical protein